MRRRYLGRLLNELTQALILKLVWKIWSWTYRAGCPSQRHGRSTAIYCPVNAEVLLEWHIPQEMSTLCAAPGYCWMWPAPLLTLSWSLGCSALSVMWKSVLQVHMALGVRDWKMSVQGFPWRSHWFAGAVTWFFTSSWIVSVFLQLDIHTHIYRKNNELQLYIAITSDALSGKLLSLRIMDCNDSNLVMSCLMHKRTP